MMLKNWTVKTVQIRNSGLKAKYKKAKSNTGNVTYQKVEGSGRRVKNGFINHVNYLKDKNRPSHRNTNITVLLNNAANILKAINERKAYRQEQKLSHGKVYNYCTSFVVSLPSELKPTVENWTQISKNIIKDIAVVTNLSVSKIAKHTHIVLHDESASADKHSHIHVLVSNVIDNDVIKAITQRITTSTVKKSVNASVKKYLGVDHTKYTPKNSKTFDKPLWLARQEKATELNKRTKALNAEIQLKHQKIVKANKLLRLLSGKFSSIKNDIAYWASDFIGGFFSDAEGTAIPLAQSIDFVDAVAPKQAEQLDFVISDIEQENKLAPQEAKVSPKRKRRRRKKPSTK